MSYFRANLEAVATAVWLGRAPLKLLATAWFIGIWLQREFRAFPMLDKLFNKTVNV